MFIKKSDGITEQIVQIGGLLGNTLSAYGITDAASATVVANHLTDSGAHGATFANTAGAPVKRDSFGDFSANIITANVKGNVTGNVTGNATTATNATTHIADTSAVHGSTENNVSNALVKRNASGNFAAGIITANLVGNVTGDLTGNANTATSALTAVSVGGVTGLANLVTDVPLSNSGSGSPGTSTLAARSDHIHPLVSDALKAPISNPVFTGNPQAPTPVSSDSSKSLATTEFVQTVVSSAPIAGALTAHTGATTNVHGSTSANTANTIVQRDNSGNFSAGTITATLNGNASTATSVGGITGIGTATPLVETGLGSIGTSTLAARQDHVHPLSGVAIGAMSYQGTWNASTNSPTLTSGVGTKGWFYKVSVPGSTSIDGNTNWTLGDLIAYDGTTWDLIQGGTSDVVSVAGRVGTVVLTTADVAASTNKNYVTDAQSTVIGNTSNTNTGDETLSTIKTKLGIATLSGTNTGDEDLSSIKTKLGITTLSGSNTGDETLATIKTKLGITTLSGVNTGDQTLSGLGGVANTVTVNGHALSANVVVTASDVGNSTAQWNANQLNGITIDSAGPVTNDIMQFDGTNWKHLQPSELVGITGGLTKSVVSTNFAAVPNNMYFVNTSGGSINATLPASPATFITIKFVDYLSTFGTYHLTILANGNKIMGLLEDLIVSTHNASVELVYVDSTVGWRLV
jgi:hypothetical protein